MHFTFLSTMASLVVVSLPFRFSVDQHDNTSITPLMTMKNKLVVLFYCLILTIKIRMGISLDDYSVNLDYYNLLSKTYLLGSIRVLDKHMH